MANQEKLSNSGESIKTHEVPAVERVVVHGRHEVLHEKAERSPEQSREKLENAKNEALKHALGSEKAESKGKEAKTPHIDRRKDGPISKSERSASYKRTMKQVQGELSGPSRTFSKIIHNKAVEKTSDLLGTTVARPNAILSGAFFAFALSLILLLTARYYGYPLSGSETIASFIIGWAIGVLFDYLRLMITGKKS